MRSVLLCIVLLCAACAGDDSCVEGLPAQCTPLYEPTFDNVFKLTLKGSCAVSGSACHAAAGGKGGLVMETADQAYDGLVTSGRALSGDAACSMVVRRLEGSGEPVMPPGNQLSAEERCSVIEWIRAGAKR